jgi:hypothetical protein
MYKFSLFSSHGDRVILLEQENEASYSFYLDLLSIFSVIDYENNIINFCCLHKMNDNIKDKIKELSSLYESQNLQVRRILQYFTEIADGEFFYVFPENDFSPEEILCIFDSIDLLNSGIPEEKLADELKKPMEQQKSLFSEIFTNYNISVYGPKKKYVYGNNEKSKRKCKYCGKTITEDATFNEEAHAIPESLGNKTIISADECDHCNDIFSKTIDLDIFEYLKLFRVLYGRKGKNGVPKLKFKNGTEIFHNGTEAIIIQRNNDPSTDTDFSKDNFKIPLEFSRDINYMNIYRALVKYVMAVIPNEEMSNFTKTIDWIMNIKNNGNVIELPIVAVKIDSQNYNDQPLLMVYKRKNNNISLPYMYAELRMTTMIFVFIIPFCGKDTKDFSQKENFDVFWNFNKHYAYFKDWTFNNFNVDIERHTIINMKMNKRSS